MGVVANDTGVAVDRAYLLHRISRLMGLLELATSDGGVRTVGEFYRQQEEGIERGFRERSAALRSTVERLDGELAANAVELARLRGLVKGLEDVETTKGKQQNEAKGGLEEHDAALALLSQIRNGQFVRQSQVLNESWREELKGKWRTLHTDKANERMLVISEEIVGQRPYHASRSNITWEGCTLRKWLNGEFYSSLPQALRDRVLPVKVRTKGSKGTTDKVFLLSTDEAKQYFKSDKDRIAKYNGSAYWWWLRSRGDYAHYAANVNYGGGVNDCGHSVNRVGGVRPALWLNLKS
jgi:hypothetical protein